MWCWQHAELIRGICLAFLIPSLLPISPSVWWDFQASAPGSLRGWKPQRLGLGSRWSWFCWELAGTARCQEWSQTPPDAPRAQTDDWGQQLVLEPGRSSPCCSAPRSSGERNPTQGEFYGKFPQPFRWADTSQWNATLPTARGQERADLLSYCETGQCSTSSKHTPKSIMQSSLGRDYKNYAGAGVWSCFHWNWASCVSSLRKLRLWGCQCQHLPQPHFLLEIELFSLCLFLYSRDSSEYLRFALALWRSLQKCMSSPCSVLPRVPLGISHYLKWSLESWSG